MDFSRVTDPNAWKQAMAGLLRRGGEVTDYIEQAPEKAGQAILEGHERNKALQAQAFANPNRPFQVTDANAMSQLGDRMLGGPLSVAPVGMTKMIGSQADALLTAQKNATLPIEQGGLGLPPNNTAMDRARALGFNTENMWFRGDKPNLTEFNPNDPSNYIKGNIFLTDKKPIAAWYARTGKQKDIMNMPSNESQGVYSLFTKTNPRELKIDANESSWADIPVPKAWKKSFYGGTGQIDDVALMANQKKYPSMQVDNVIDQYGVGSQKVIFKPSDIRSVNAAFDPKRANEANILAGAVPLGAIAQTEEGKQTRKELLEQLLNKQK